MDRQGAPAGGGAASGARDLGFTGGDGAEEEWGQVGSSVEEEIRRLATGMDDAVLLAITLKGGKVSWWFFDGTCGMEVDNVRGVRRGNTGCESSVEESDRIVGIGTKYNALLCQPAKRDAILMNSKRCHKYRSYHFVGVD